MKYKFTNFIIGGPLAGLHRSPLDLFFAFRIKSCNHQRSILTNLLIFERIISWRRLWGIRFSCNFLLCDKRLMVRTRSRATSPSHQGSRSASSNPYHGPQSAPAMQTLSAQHVQSMAAAMAELTRQNQELRREINLRR